MQNPNEDALYIPSPEEAPTEDDDQQEVPEEQSEVEYTPEEVQEIKALAKSLMDPQEKKSDKFVLGACITLLAARQTYMAALTDLNKRLIELEVGHLDGVRQTLVDAMQNQAMVPYTRQSLMEKLQRHVLPWVMATSQSEDAKIAAEDRDREKRLDETRRESLVPIGFPIEKDLPDDPKMLTRDRTLALAGHPGAVKYLLRVAIQEALKQKEQRNVAKLRVIHLSCYDKGWRNVSKKANKDKLHLVLEQEQWLNKCPSDKKFGEFMLGWCKIMRRRGIDLLVIDDLTQIMAAKLEHHSPFMVAGQAHRTVRRWAERAGCAVICGLPIELSEDFAATAVPPREDSWEQLEVYTTLQRVEVREGEYDEDYEHDTYQIYLHESGALAANLVGREIIDNYKG